MRLNQPFSPLDEDEKNMKEEIQRLEDFSDLIMPQLSKMLNEKLDACVEELKCEIQKTYFKTYKEAFMEGFKAGIEIGK